VTEDQVDRVFVGMLKHRVSLTIDVFTADAVDAVTEAANLFREMLTVSGEDAPWFDVTLPCGEVVDLQEPVL
jgi:hypothetical protein